MAESFRLANFARASRVDESLIAAAARASLHDASIASLARQEQQALQRIRALNGLLARSGGRDLISGADRDALVGRIRKAKAARSALLKEIAETSPDYLALIDPSPPTVQDIASWLRQGEAVIAIYSSASSTHVWLVRSPEVIEYHRANVSAAKVERWVAELRTALDPDASTLDELPQFDTELAYRLYRQILGPLESELARVDSLIVIPHRALAQLPFSLLPTNPTLAGNGGSLALSAYREVPWLIRRFSVSQLPSASSLLTLRLTNRGSQSDRPFIGFGDPVFDPEDESQPIATTHTNLLVRRSVPSTRTVDTASVAKLPRLLDTATEIIGIAQAVGAELKRDVHLQTDANEEKVKSLSNSGELRRYAIVTFATHGLVPGDLDGLTQPALALSSPEAAGVEGDGLLDMREVLELHLDADWAVLSACNTAAADGAGTEAVSGLGRAFFFAGARGLLVSNWPVHSPATTYLMTGLFDRYARNPRMRRARHFREAMLDMIDNGVYRASGRDWFSYAHPLFWAPFTLIGD